MTHGTIVGAIAVSLITRDLDAVYVIAAHAIGGKFLLFLRLYLSLPTHATEETLLLL